MDGVGDEKADEAECVITLHGEVGGIRRVEPNACVCISAIDYALQTSLVVIMVDCVDDSSVMLPKARYVLCWYGRSCTGIKYPSRRAKRRGKSRSEEHAVRHCPSRGQRGLLYSKAQYSWPQLGCTFPMWHQGEVRQNCGSHPVVSPHQQCWVFWRPP